MSERLTKRDRYGHAYTNETIYDRGMTSEDGVHYEKHYFENETSSYDGKPIDRLCEIEDKICEGKIVELPCAVGNIVYAPHWHWGTYIKGEIMPYQITNITITQNKKGEWTKKYRAMEVQNGKTIDWQLNFEFDAIGKTVFLTREEAEKALERSEG